MTGNGSRWTACRNIVESWSVPISLHKTKFYAHLRWLRWWPVDDSLCPWSIGGVHSDGLTTQRWSTAYKTSSEVLDNRWTVVRSVIVILSVIDPLKSCLSYYTSCSIWCTTGIITWTAVVFAVHSITSRSDIVTNSDSSPLSAIWDHVRRGAVYCRPQSIDLHVKFACSLAQFTQSLFAGKYMFLSFPRTMSTSRFESEAHEEVARVTRRHVRNDVF